MNAIVAAYLLILQRRSRKQTLRTDIRIQKMAATNRKNNKWKISNTAFNLSRSASAKISRKKTDETYANKTTAEIMEIMQTLEDLRVKNLIEKLLTGYQAYHKSATTNSIAGAQELERQRSIVIARIPESEESLPSKKNTADFEQVT
jgi:hypothetical protein